MLPEITVIARIDNYPCQRDCPMIIAPPPSFLPLIYSLPCLVPTQQVAPSSNIARG